MLALGRYEAKVCRCGVHESMTDPERHAYTFDVTTCPVCAGWARYQRVLAAQDAEQEKLADRDAPASTPKPSDGRQVRLRPMPPSEVAARKAQKPS